MKKSEKITGVMMLKAFSEIGRNSFEIAIITLSDKWLQKTLKTTALLETMKIGSYSGYITQQQFDVPFLLCRDSQAPFYEQWLGENDLAFLDAEFNEIQQLCRHFESINSTALLIHANGMANYEAGTDRKFRTVDFDLKLIQEILTHQN